MDFKTPLVLATAFFVLLPGTLFSIGKPRRGQTVLIHAILFGLLASVLQPLLGLATEGFQTDNSGNSVDVNKAISDNIQTAFQDPKIMLENMNYMFKNSWPSMFNIKPFNGIGGDFKKYMSSQSSSSQSSSSKSYNTAKSSNNVTCEQVDDLMGYCPPNTCNVSVYTIPMNLRNDKTEEYIILYEQNPSKGKIIQSSKCNNIMYVDTNNTITGGIQGNGMLIDVKDGVLIVGAEVPYTSHPNYKANTKVVPKSVDLKFRDKYIPPQPADTGLSTGAIIGIVIGSLVGLGLLIALVMYFSSSSTTQ